MRNRTVNLILAMLFQLCLFAQNKEAVSLSPEVIYERYEEAFLSQDIEQIMELYTRNAVLVTPDGSRFKGQDQIRSTYEKAFKYYPVDLTFDTFSFVVEDELVFHTYSIWNEGSGEKLVPFSTETVFIEKGKIRYHTIAEYDPARDVRSPLALSIPENWVSQTSRLPRYFAPNVFEGIADCSFTFALRLSSGTEY